MRTARPAAVTLGLSLALEGTWLLSAPRKGLSAPAWNTLRDATGLTPWGIVLLVVGCAAVVSALCFWRAMFVVLVFVTALQLATAFFFILSAGQHSGSGVFGAIQALALAAITVVFGIRAAGLSTEEI